MSMKTQDENLLSREHIVRWVHDMYTRGRDPLESIERQASTRHGSARGIESDVLLACRPGNHDIATEASKRKYTLQWRAKNK